MIRKREKVILLMLAIIFLLLIIRIFYLMIFDSNRDSANAAILNRSIYSLERLQEQSNKIDLMSKNIEEYSFSEIKKSIDDTVYLIGLSNREMNAQYNAWLYIKKNMSDDYKTYTGLRDNLSQIQKLQIEEILRLKTLLEEAEKPSIIADIYNLFLSFIVGVISSIASTLLIKKIKLKNDSKKST